MAAARTAGRSGLGDDLTEEDAEAHVHGVCFKTGPPIRTGVEVEWLVHDRSDPRELIPPGRLDPALVPVEVPGALPGGSRLTREPGGQVELSSRPAESVAGCVSAMAADLTVLRTALEGAGLVLVGSGLDAHRDPPRVLDHPRYRAMERFFDREGPWGRTMMRRTASLQVNLDAGDDTPGITGYRARWALVHRLGPVMVAAFANSPFSEGRPNGWLSNRQAVWSRMDPGRTLHPAHHGDPRTSWVRYAMDARLLCVRPGAETPGGAVDGSPDGLPGPPPGPRRTGRRHPASPSGSGCAACRGCAARPSRTSTTTSAPSSRRCARAAGWSCG
ncbi:glutamate-cysteine ligase family protein [Actinacidiphila yeochonensis]|uniref:glutamate-cysteine ligase family protein n=1 Tax=Actinacidiphila yeochonensis TaxID=89050 RepID=UPI000B18F507|nr:glutamate-cysteine ligase family protein [Actinacidiphila yeochonensis]